MDNAFEDFEPYIFGWPSFLYFFNIVSIISLFVRVLGYLHCMHMRDMFFCLFLIIRSFLMSSLFAFVQIWKLTSIFNRNLNHVTSSNSHSFALAAIVGGGG